MGRPLWVKDNSKIEAPFTFPKTYFKASLVGYVLGLLATLGVMMIWDHAQPALLYLVPGVLGSIWLTAVFRGELSLLWNYTEAIEEEHDQKSGKEDKDGGSVKAEGDKRITRSQSKVYIDGGADSATEDETSRPRRDRRNRPERELFSFTIEAPPSLKKSKTNKKHARNVTVDTDNTLARNSTSGASTAVNVGAEPVGKRQRLI
jgi:minor histocompatibility antigen H13